MNPQFGMALGVAAYFMFSLHDASNKWLVATVPVWQVLFCRSLLIVVAGLVIGRKRLVEEIAATPLKRALMLRGLLTLVAWLCYYSAARFLPLAQLLTLYFAAPLLVTVLSQPLLGERVTRVRWLSVGIGFTGVLVASDPFGVRLGWPTVLALIAAALWGYGVILMRQIARRERSLLQMVVGNLVFTAVTGVMCLFHWVPLQLPDLALVVAVALFGGLGQFLMFEAARRAPAAVMATVEYSALLWAFILGFVIWHDIPPPAIWAGAGLILLAGAVLLRSERCVAAG
jgi:drug/metabolite transporter (DMT)-like permease